jgi:hypothetical protein
MSRSLFTFDELALECSQWQQSIKDMLLVSISLVLASI